MENNGKPLAKSQLIELFIENTSAADILVFATPFFAGKLSE